MHNTLWQDLRYAVRTLRRARGASFLIVGMLAVVIGVTTSIFSVANTLLLRPAAGREPDQLVRVYMNRGSNVHFAEYVDLRDRTKTLDLAAFVAQRVSVGSGNETEAVFAEMLTGNYAAVVGVAPLLGRMLRPDDDRPGATPVVVLSEQYWRTRLAADARVLGRTVEINNATFAIVGVMPEPFHGAHEITVADLWLPMTLDPLLRPGTTTLVDRAASRGVQVIGRLRPGVAIEAAQTDLTAIGNALALEYPDTPASRRPSVYEAWLFPPEFRAPILIFFGVLLAVSGVLLVAACANVANVLLARGAGKSREMALRQAIGATRWRLVRQQLAEGLVLSATASGGALVLTWWFTRILATVRLPMPQPVALDVPFDAGVVLFACGLAAATTVLCALAPALQGTRGHLLSALRTGEATTSTRSRLRSAFVVAQVTSSVLLLIVAGLFLKGLGRAAAVDLGMDTSRVLLVSLDTETRGYTRERATAFYDRLLDRVRAAPGVAAASLTDVVPLSLDNKAMGMNVNDAERRVQVTFNSVSRGAFATLGIRLLDGRDFDARDVEGGTRVAIVNEALARRWFGTGPVVGRRFLGPGGPGNPSLEYEIVGVAANATYTRIGEEQDLFAYFPITQIFVPAPTLMVRAAGGDPIALASEMRAAVRSLDAALPIVSIRTFESSSSISLLPARVAAVVTGILGALVLVLATVGLYGVVAFMVRQRRREIGIRMALGATRGRVAGLFLQQSVRWAAIGLAIGVALAAAATRAIGALLFGLSPLDPATFGGVVVLMVAVTCAASYIPARRAAGLNPVQALRTD